MSKTTELAEKLDTSYSSHSMVKIVANLQKNKKDILKNMNKAQEKDQRVPDDMVDELVLEVINKYGDEVRDYLEKI